MSGKRSRQIFETDLQTQHSPFVFIGTPLPPQDGETRDDGSYVPIHLQEVRDEKGRRRLHGAFTGGWSAGYFNTVGSKEGWTPATFVSSPATRSRRKDSQPAVHWRPEDFMDEEDLADAAIAESIQTRHAFAGLGTTEHEERRTGIVELILPTQSETMGFKLLKKMGWKDGQGIGPKIRRMARLGTSTGGESYIFAPDRVSMISFTRKLDRKGLGWDQEPGMLLSQRSRDESGEDVDTGSKHKSKEPRMTLSGNFPESTRRDKAVAGAIGVGIFNDTGSDDEDPYEIGPRISYSRVIGGEKKKRKKTASTPMAANPMVKSRPTFAPKKTAILDIECELPSRLGGRPLLHGFVQGGQLDTIVSMANSDGKYTPPVVPHGWKSSRADALSPSSGPAAPTADAMVAFKLDPKSRAALLGENPLPGKSVFDYLTPAARERLASASGRSDLPPARAEVPVGQMATEDEKLRDVMRQLPVLEPETALAVITRGLSGGTPYRDDEAKQGRYRSYLEHFAGFGTAMPSRPTGMTLQAFAEELREFHNCATIFKPMTGAMASRFTTSQAPSRMLGESSGKVPGRDLLSKPQPKPTSPAEEAAKVDMYGSLTRSVQDFFPVRLLCKRFNVKAPDHAQSEKEPSSTSGREPQTTRYWDDPRERGLEIPLQGAVRESPPPGVVEAKATGASVIPERRRADDDVFKAVFGDDSDEEAS